MAEQRKQFGRSFVAAFALLVVLTIVCAVAHSAIARQLNAWKLLPQPERFTELYFTHPTSLPTTYTPGQLQTVSFTAHNLEYRTTTYNFTISASSSFGGGTQTLARGVFTLQQNQAKNVAQALTLPPLGSHELITVTLNNVSDSIDYWLNLKTEGK